MDGDVSSVRTSRHDHNSYNRRYESYDRNSNYTGIQSGRRKVVGSPEVIVDQKIVSPVISPLNNMHSITKEIFTISPSENNTSIYPSYLDNGTTNNGGNSFKTKALSPSATEVSMPGGMVV